MVMKPTRTRIICNDRDVTVERTDPITDERTTTTYYVPLTREEDGLAYVHIRGAENRQVCAGLYSTGDTLMARPSTIGAVIRRELRRRQRDEARILRGKED